ncbi:MAG: hybrid sensor histidine kinase/response regulator, partial [Microcoleus sp. CAN_BIN18]|nr:hybrid sensor histidine kinase/response regulator [Microcoleus sp. CAN_BIN18]
FVRKPFPEKTIFEIMAKHLGVSYAYESSELNYRPDNQAGEPVNLTIFLAAMSRKWIVKLHEAALEADSELVSRLLDTIPSSYLLELHTLRDWVNTFQFEKILDLTEPLVEQ